MCLIVDANVATTFFSGQPDEHSIPALKWIFDGDGRLVFGGLLTAEFQRAGIALRTLKAWSRAGKATEFPADQVAAKTRQIRDCGRCVSNDYHVIALAIVSGARVLFTHDGPLQKDFKNKFLIDKPRGKVYQNSSHVKLLQHSRSCGYAG